MNSFLSKYNKVVGIVSPYLLVGYFILTYIPYFVGRFAPLLNFFASYDIYYRGVLSIAFIAITISHYLLSKERRIRYLLIFALLCFYFALGALCVPPELTIRHNFSNSHAIIDVSLEVGFRDIVVGLLNSFFDLYFCFYLLVFGVSVINKKTINILLYFAFFASLVESLLTFVLDRSSYFALLSLNFDNVYDLNISGTFQSKNGLGFLLFQGVLSSFILIRKSTKKWEKVLLVCGLGIIMIVSLLSFCKTSAIISIFACLVFSISSICKKRMKVFERILYIVIAALFTALFLLIMILPLLVPQIFETGTFGKVVISIRNTVLERLQIWYESTYLLEIPQLFIGYSKGVSGYLLHLVDENLSSYYFHNGFVTILVNYGLIGLITYVIVTIKIYKRRKFLALDYRKLFNIIFWSSIAYTFFEAYHLFLSGSPVVMLQSVLIVYLPILYSDYLERSRENKYAITQEKYYVVSI